MGSKRESLIAEAYNHLKIAEGTEIIVLYGKTILAPLARIILKSFHIQAGIYQFDRKYAKEGDSYELFRDACVILCGSTPSTRESMQSDAMRLFGGAIQCIDIFPMYYLWVLTCVRRKCDMEVLAETVDQARTDVHAVNLAMVNTSCCTLKCKDCSNGIPYRKKLFVTDPKQFVNDLSRITELTPVYQLVIHGGEALLDRNLPEELYHVAENPNVAVIVLITNGTLIPSDDVVEALKETGTILMISDYGEHSPKLEDIIRMSGKEGIPCEPYERAKEWSVYGEWERHHRSEEENRQIARDCFFGTKCIYIYDGTLYCCSRTMAAVAQEESVEAASYNCMPIDESLTKENLFNLINGKELYRMCDYCDWPMKTVAPAEQLQ